MGEEQIHYSPSRRGFFRTGVHLAGLPSDVKLITAERHAELMEGQRQGRKIIPGDDGLPVLTDPPAPSAEEARVLLNRRIDAVLARTAWTQAPDEPDDFRAAWAQYRQAVRALRSADDPLAAAWPPEPAI